MRVYLKWVAGMPSRMRRRGSLGRAWSVRYLLVCGVEIEVVGRSGPGYTAWAYTSPRRGRVMLWDVSSWGEMSMKKRKPRDVSAGTPVHLAPLECAVLAQHHSIVKHCAITRYDDGDPRQVGWVSIRTVGGVWQVEAKDPDTCQFLRVQQPSLDDALTLLALLLDSEDAPWEHDAWAARQKPRQKK